MALLRQVQNGTPQLQGNIIISLVFCQQILVYLPCMFDIFVQQLRYHIAIGIVLLILLLLGRPSAKILRLRRFKSVRDEIWQDCFSGKWASIDRSRMFDLMSRFQHGGHNVILRRKVLPCGECTAHAASARCPVHPPSAA